MDETIGKVYLGRFRVDEILSPGDSFVRYRGFDLKRSLPLSIRVFDFVIPPDQAVLCFQQNNLTLQTITHPNIIPFYGLYEAEGKSFAVEKFMEGPSLAQILRQRGGAPMPPNEALIYVKALANALEYVHGFGLVHATLAPINVQAARDGSILLSNFGFARMLDNRMSDVGAYGPPICQAPEQLRKEKVYPATDLYALGILFYEFLTGVHPFLGAPSSTVEGNPAGAEALRQGHLTQDPPDPRRYNSHLPAGISDTLKIALSKNPKERYQSAQEMLEIACAVLGTGPQQVPERLGGNRPVSPTQVVPRGTQQAGNPPSPYASPQAPVGPTAAVAYNAGPRAGERPGAGGTQVVPGQAWQPAGPGPSTQVAPPVTGALGEEKRKRPAWLMPMLGLLVVAVLLCVGVGVWAGLPFLQELIGAATATPTATLTPTPTFTMTAPAIPPTQPSPPAAPPTEPVVIPPTEPPPPPSETPTEIPSATPTPKPAAFKVTIQNNGGFPIYAFRDGSLMGTDPIPPGMYIYYLNIPAGPHQFRFCMDARQSQCPYGKQVDVEDDMTIRVK